MAGIGDTRLILRFFGDDLDPAELTKLLGEAPTQSWVKGEARHSTSRHRVQKTGAWLFSVPDREPGDLDGQLNELFSKLTDDIETWRALTSRFDGNCFCGLFMRECNEGFDLDLKTIEALAARGLRIGFDIYDPADD
jgi:hypothetical protein